MTNCKVETVAQYWLYCRAHTKQKWISVPWMSLINIHCQGIVEWVEWELRNNTHHGKIPNTSKLSIIFYQRWKIVHVAIVIIANACRHNNVDKYCQGFWMYRSKIRCLLCFKSTMRHTWLAVWTSSIRYRCQLCDSFDIPFKFSTKNYDALQ